MTQKTRSNALTAALGAGALLFSSLLVAPSAQAAPITDFNAGFIISDAVMYNYRSMSPAQVAAFIATQGANCVAAPGNICLKNYRETTPSRPATAFCPRSYQGAPNESAAAIIAKSATACGINPQVLLVTLQKEQTLVYQANPIGRPSASYTIALGFGCPEDPAGGGATCRAEYTGFANQIYSAASRLKQYAAEPTKFNHQPGRYNKVLFHPNEAACGSSQVFIHNQATASLYNYTPYQPNVAALAAGSGIGDACSSYGNRNFYTYFKLWFGDPKAAHPAAVVADDAPDAIDTPDASESQVSYDVPAMQIWTRP